LIGAVVSDSTCLIALHNIDRLDILERLFTRIFVPPAVAREFGSPVAMFSIQEPRDANALAAACIKVDWGEAEAIALALELGLPLIVDDQKGRKYAESVGLKVVGTAGVLLLAKQHKIVGEVRPFLNDLRAAGFYLSDEIIRFILEVAGEQS
jgi:uncharacterized protein